VAQSGLALSLVSVLGCGGPSQAAAKGETHALVSVRLGGPWSAAAGKTPKATGPFGYAVALVTSAFLKAHPNIQKAWWAATAAGIAEIRKDGDAYLRFYSERSGYSVPVLKQTQALAYGDQPDRSRGQGVGEFDSRFSCTSSARPRRASRSTSG
jgi:ABC-type nitrate/sulfonate/bicarbonate transport system substrate-binding protein